MSNNIRHIPSHMNTNSAITFFNPKPYLVMIYRRYFKRFKVVRSVAIFLWTKGYPPYIAVVAKFHRRKLRKWIRLIKVTQFITIRETQRYKLSDKETIRTSIPNVSPNVDRGYLIPPYDRYTFPEIFVITIGDGLIYGGTNLIKVDKVIVCHDLFDFERDYTSEELHHRVIIDPKQSRIRWLQQDKKLEHVQAAACFVDACAPNYAHWLTEVLPRIMIFCSEERFKDVPIVVNSDLHSNIMESLMLVVGTERKIITLPIGRALAVEKLYVTSVTGYVPFGRRNNKLSGHSHGIFSPRAFEQLRDTMNENIREMEDEDWPEKIFLRRNSGVRKVVNSEEIETLLVSDGFVIVEPEKLTFLQQLQLFKHAKTIVSSTGAALASAVFCMPKTKVIVIMSIHEDMIYRYWYIMLHPLNINVGYVLGHTINSDQEMHSDFIVNTADVLSILKVMED